MYQDPRPAWQTAFSSLMQKAWHHCRILGSWAATFLWGCSRCHQGTEFGGSILDHHTGRGGRPPELLHDGSAPRYCVPSALVEWGGPLTFLRTLVGWRVLQPHV